MRKAKYSMAPSIRPAGKRLQQRSSSAGNVSVSLPVISSSKRFVEESLDMFEAFKSINESIEPYAFRCSGKPAVENAKAGEERGKAGTTQAEQTLDDKQIDSSMQEPNCEANLRRLSKNLSDLKILQPSKLHALSGLPKLTEQLKGSQQNVAEAHRVGVAPIFEASKNKSELLMANQDAWSTNFKETRPLARTKTRSKSTWPKRELFDRPDKSEDNYLVFRKRFHPFREKVPAKPIHWQQHLRLDVEIPDDRSKYMRSILSDYNFRQ